MKKKILIIDDHDDFRAMLKEYLYRQKLGLEVYEASSGEMGVAKSSFVKPHIILMDISLPRINGFEAARQIKEDNPFCDIIILTIFDVTVFKKAAEQIKVMAFVGKSDVYEKLLPVIKECLNNKRRVI